MGKKYKEKTQAFLNVYIWYALKIKVHSNSCAVIMALLILLLVF